VRAEAQFPAEGVPFSLIVTIEDPDRIQPIFQQFRRQLVTQRVDLHDIRTALRLRARISALRSDLLALVASAIAPTILEPCRRPSACRDQNLLGAKRRMIMAGSGEHNSSPERSEHCTLSRPSIRYSERLRARPEPIVGLASVFAEAVGDHSAGFLARSKRFQERGAMGVRTPPSAECLTASTRRELRSAARNPGVLYVPSRRSRASWA
jgi:hypothetical protein